MNFWLRRHRRSKGTLHLSEGLPGTLQTVRKTGSCRGDVDTCGPTGVVSSVLRIDGEVHPHRTFPSRSSSTGGDRSTSPQKESVCAISHKRPSDTQDDLPKSRGVNQTKGPCTWKTSTGKGTIPITLSYSLWCFMFFDVL